VAQIVAAGFPIGNHSYSHPDFTKLTDAQMRSQLSRTASAIVKAGAEDPKPLFRPPYGARNKHVLAVLRSAGYVSVYWTIDTLDWETTRTPAQIEHAVMSKLKPGAIILMHVGSKQTASILPTLLEEIKAQGYSFVTLREALPSSVK
jgi:peptidoglycan/xylan/chitin deacetylase (PgdA/CDA1 family)